MTFRYSILAASMISCLAALAMSDPAFAAKMEHPVVVELYTSQGCSDCPAADAYLGELTERKDVIALTFAVRYWDYLGWVDSFGTPENDQRQSDYVSRIVQSKKHQGRSLDNVRYTPQMILDGRVHAVGSDRIAVAYEIERLRSEKPKTSIAVSAKVSGDSIVVTVDGKSGIAATSATLWLAYYSKKEKVSIRRGENRGKDVNYHNVVRQMTPIAKWSGERLEEKLPKTDLMNQGYDGCAVILQVNGNGPIIGAAAIDDWMGN